MTNEQIQFDIDSQIHPQYKKRTSKLVGLVMKYSGGLIEDEDRANMVLLGLAVVIMIFSFFLWKSNDPVVLNPEEVQQTVLEVQQMNTISL